MVSVSNLCARMFSVAGYTLNWKWKRLIPYNLKGICLFVQTSRLDKEDAKAIKDLFAGRLK